AGGHPPRAPVDCEARVAEPGPVLDEGPPAQRGQRSGPGFDASRLQRGGRRATRSRGKERDEGARERKKDQPAPAELSVSSVHPLLSRRTGRSPNTRGGVDAVVQHARKSDLPGVSLTSALSPRR